MGGGLGGHPDLACRQARHLRRPLERAPRERGRRRGGDRQSSRSDVWGVLVEATEAMPEASALLHTCCLPQHTFSPPAVCRFDLQPLSPPALWLSSRSRSLPSTRGASSSGFATSRYMLALGNISGASICGRGREMCAPLELPQDPSPGAEKGQLTEECLNQHVLQR